MGLHAAPTSPATTALVAGLARASIRPRSICAGRPADQLGVIRRTDAEQLDSLRLNAQTVDRLRKGNRGRRVAPDTAVNRADGPDVVGFEIRPSCGRRQGDV